MAPVFTCEQITVEVSLSRRPRTSDYRIISSHTLINQPTWRQLIQSKCDSCSRAGTIQEEEGPPHTSLKVSVRLRVWCSRTTDVRSNAGVYFMSNKCAQSFEVVTVARIFTEIPGDRSDKDELQWRPRNTEEDHRHSVAELPVTLVIIISQRADSSSSLRLPAEHHYSSPI